MVETIPLRMVGNYTDGIGWELNRWSQSPINHNIFDNADMVEDPDGD